MNHEFRRLDSAESVVRIQLEKMIEKTLTESGTKENEGHHGIILRLDLSIFSPEELAELEQMLGFPIERDSETAVKVLKIYQKGEAEKEFSLQAEASDAVNNAQELNDKVGIPQCYFGGELSLSNDELKSRLRDWGVALPDRIGVVIMDMIEGEDLGIFCYKEFIKEHFDKFKSYLGIIKKDIPPEEYDSYLKGRSIEDLIYACHYILEFQAKYKYFDSSYEAQQERSQVAKMLLENLENRGLLGKDKISALRQAINIMHQAGIYHRDLHLRNILLDESGKMFIIDFGSAKKIDVQNESELDRVYNSTDGSIMQSDDAILNFLGRLAKTPEEAQAEKIQQHLELPLRLKKIITEALDKKKLSSREKNFVNYWKMFQKDIASGKSLEEGLKKFSYNFGEYAETDAYFDYQIAGLLLLSEHGFIDLVKDFCNQKINDVKTNKKMITRLRELLELI